MKGFFTILSLLIFIQISAIDVDELLLQLNKAQAANDLVKLAELNSELASIYYRDQDYAEALHYYHQALELTDEGCEKAFILRSIGKVYVDSTHFSLALVFLDRALDADQKAGGCPEISDIHDLIGMCYGLTNNLDKAIEAFKSGLEQKIEMKDSLGIGLSYYNIGLAWYFKGQSDKAVEHFVKSAEIRQHLPDTNAFVSSLISIGEIFRNREEYANARIYYNEALKCRQALSDPQTLAYLYSEMALIYKESKEYALSLAYIDTAMAYCRDIEYKRGIATLYSYKAGIAVNQGKDEEALQLYMQTIPMYKEIGFELGRVQSRISIAEILIRKDKLDAALRELNRVEEMAKNNQILEEQYDIARLKYDIYRKTGKWKLAVEEAENYMVLRDSVFNIGKEEKINEIEERYQNEQKQRQIELLDKENQIKQHELEKKVQQDREKEQKIASRTRWLIASMILLLLIAVLFVLLYRQNKLRYQLRVEQGRQKLLRSQMNPHFMYNALAAIQNYILKNEAMDTVQYISDFSSLMRLVLEGSRNDFVSLKDDICLVKSYLRLQQVRFNADFEVDVYVDDELNTELLELPPMLSQPFIENAVEHGMRNLSKGKGLVKISYKKMGDAVLVIISDNGVGLDSKPQDKNHRSMAMKITKERIENIKRMHRFEIEMSVSSEIGEGTEIRLLVPQFKRRS